MENTKEIIFLKSYISHPLGYLLSYRNSYSEMALLAYIICICLSMCWLVYWTYKWAFSYSSHIILKQIYIAVSENNFNKCVELISRYPHLINKKLYPEGYTPFMKACLNGNTTLVKVMLINGADVNLKSIRNENPFYLAVYNHIKNPTMKDASCIHALYYAGADINAVNEKGYNALQLASAFGHSSLVQWLLSKGARINICN